MTKLLKYLLFTVALLVNSITVPAQTSLPRLREDKAVHRGTLNSGITSYIVENPVVKGRADAALVRCEDCSAHDCGGELEPFAGFLSRSGIAPSPRGYVNYGEGSVSFRFPSVPVQDAQVADSTLLMLFSLAANSTADQAVIISGDVSSSAIKAKMDIFSLMIPRRNVGVRQESRTWEPSPAPKWNIVTGTGEDRTRIKVSYSAPRLPQNRRGTSQALIPMLFAGQFGELVQRRIERSFRQGGIPCSGLEFDYIGTGDSSGDEIYSVSVVTDTLHTEAALERLATVLGGIDDFGAGRDEYRNLRASGRRGIESLTSTKVSDAEYVRRCTSHFLYRTNLAPAEDYVNMAVRRALDDSTWVSLFNSYNNAWLGRLENLTLDISSGKDSLDSDEVIFKYNLNYLFGSTAGDPVSYDWMGADTLMLQPNYPKVRLRETRPEPITGGEMLIYANGITVIYKQMASAQGISYAVLWPGGTESVEDLVPGEGPFLPEMLPLLDVDGRNCADFRDMLASGGITMEADIFNRFFIVRGNAPSDGVPLLLSSLLSLTGNSKLNREAWENWRRGAAMRPESPLSRLMAAKYPGYQYMSSPLVDALSDKTADKAEQFYRTRFTRMNEATIVIVGNVEEAALKKQLSGYLGGFRTGNPTQKKIVRYNPSPVHMVMKEGSGAMLANYYAPMSLSAPSYYTSMVLDEHLSRVLPGFFAAHGLSVSVSCGFRSFPQENIQLVVDCRPMPAESLPPGFEIVAPENWPGLLEKALKGAPAPSAQELALYKERVKLATGELTSSSDGLVSMVLIRLINGKNLVMNAQSTISGVDAAAVQDMLKQLLGGGSIEYIYGR